MGDYVADLAVEKVIVEFAKCASGSMHQINYLKAPGLRVALLLTFERSNVEWKRLVLDHGACDPTRPARTPAAHCRPPVRA